MAKKKSKLDSLRVDKNTLLGVHLKEELNKLFYEEPKYGDELDMLDFQYSQEEKVRMGLHASSVTNATKSFCYKEQVVSILYKEYVDAGRKPPKIISKAFDRITENSRKMPINILRIFEEGNSIGAKWQRLFIRGGIGKKEDMDVSRTVLEYDLSYTPDAFVTIDGHKYVVEIKSQNTNSFDRDKSHPGGIKQLKLYMFFSGVKRGFVLVENKNNQNFKVLPVTDVTEDDEHIDQYLSTMRKIQREKKRVLRTKKLRNCKECNGVLCK